MQLFSVGRKHRRQILHRATDALVLEESQRSLHTAGGKGLDTPTRHHTTIRRGGRLHWDYSTPPCASTALRSHH